MSSLIVQLFTNRNAIWFRMTRIDYKTGDKKTLGVKGHLDLRPLKSHFSESRAENKREIIR